MNITEIVQRVWEITGASKSKTRRSRFHFKLTCTDGENYSASFKFYGGYEYGVGKTAQEAVENAYSNVAAALKAHPLEGDGIG